MLILGLKFERIRILPLLIVAGVFAVMAWVGSQASAIGGEPSGVSGPVTKGIGNMLFSDFLAAFEIIDVLLVAALIGGVYLAKREVETREKVQEAIETQPRIEAEEAEEDMEVTTDGSG